MCDAPHIGLRDAPHLREERYLQWGSGVMSRETNLQHQPTEWTSEPSLSELLSDPIAQALMVADGVKCHDLAALFASAQCRHLPAMREDLPGSH